MVYRFGYQLSIDFGVMVYFLIKGLVLESRPLLNKRGREDDRDKDRSLFYLPHLWVTLNESSHHLWVGHETLGEGRIHDRSQHVGLGHHLIRQSLLHFHEVGRAHPERGHAGKATHGPQSEGLSARIYKEKTRKNDRGWLG